MMTMPFSHQKNKSLIVVSGPTASGKTTLAIELAKKLNTQIISADSRQFYSEMKIGTAAPTLKELSEVKHHFVGNKSITDKYDIYKYELDVIELLDKLFLEFDNVVLCGGSGLYIDAVVNGIDELPDPDLTYRKFLKNKIKEGKLSELLDELKEIDLEYYNIVDKKNPTRVMRGLEVYQSTGEKFSDLRKGENKKRNFNTYKFFIDMPRELIYDRINRRVDLMISDGLVSEATKLYEYKNYNSLKTVGYSEIFKYLENEYTLEQAIEKIKTNSRRYAKRQLTWIKRDKNYIPIQTSDDIIEYLKANKII